MHRAPTRCVIFALAVLLSPAATRLAYAQTGNGGTPPLEELFTLLDKDGDGRISKQEATGAYAQRFSQWDADGDGFATRKEVHDFRVSRGLDDSGKRSASSASSAPAATATDRGQRRAPAEAVLLKEPTDWRLETMPIPPGFAPDIKLKGNEEIRFAPGMFDTASSNYFTCVIAITAGNAPEAGAEDVKDFLEKYYRGLSTGLGQRKGFKFDAAEMRATVKPAANAAKNHFTGEVIFFDSFSDGRKITLRVEAQVLAQPAAKKTVLLLLVSPSAKDSAAWKTLREIGKKITLNLTQAK